MDTQATEPNSGELSLDTAADAFHALLNGPEEVEPTVDTEIDPPKKPAEGDDKEAEDNAQEEGDDAPITIEVDGKQVPLTKAQIAEAYKNGLRQSDYTQKTMALAEQRKAAEAETLKAQQERQTYAQNLTKSAAQLEGALQEQAKIDWDALLVQDPVEFIKQKHLEQKRQAELQKITQGLQQITEQTKSEQAAQHQAHLTAQQQELLAKLPEWKDEAKAKSEREALKSYLTEAGYDKSAIDNISDHKAVVLARKAMLYDQMMSKAQAAAKKVSNLPQRVERPGVSNEVNDDSRKAAMRRHSQEGTLDSLANAFTSMLG